MVYMMCRLYHGLLLALCCVLYVYIIVNTKLYTCTTVYYYVLTNLLSAYTCCLLYILLIDNNKVSIKHSLYTLFYMSPLLLCYITIFTVHVIAQYHHHCR